MSFAQDRKTGMQMATKAGASKTAKLIQNEHAGFGAIFDSAAAEIGKDALVKHVLEGPPFWSHMALLHMDDMGGDEAALRARAAQAPADMVRPEAGSELLAENDVALAGELGGPLSAMNLHNAMAANCQWTVKWMNGGVEQPTTNYPNWDKWQWSGTLTAGCGSQMALSKIAAKVPNAPLNNGDTVWIYVWVQAGSDKSSKDSTFQFTYQSGSTKIAYWNISGTTTINSLSLNNYK